MQQLEKRVTCGVSPLVRLAKAGRLARRVALGLSEGVPMAVSAFTIALGDSNSLVTGEAQQEGLLEVLAAASASSSAAEASTSKGEEGCWLATGEPLTVTSTGLSRQGAGAQEAASKRPAPEAEEGPLNESEMELPLTMSALRADGTSSGVAVRGIEE